MKVSDNYGICSIKECKNGLPIAYTYRKISTVTIKWMDHLF